MARLLDLIHVRYECALHTVVRVGDVLSIDGEAFTVTRARKGRLRPYRWSLTAERHQTPRDGAVTHRVVTGAVFAAQPGFGPHTGTQGLPDRGEW